MNMTKEVKANRNAESKKAVVNFMGGVSYEINPLDTLKMVSASSIFGEPAYYRDGGNSEKKILDGKYTVDRAMTKYVIHALDKYKGMTTSTLMEKVIDEALTYDFKGVLDWAVTLRDEFNMRLNPQIIAVRAALHPSRKEFTDKNAGYFNSIQQKIMSRGDDVISQITYILYLNKSKKNIPNILKRTWANKVSSLSRYELYKYRNHGIGLIDAIRICHASGNDINELMQTGTIAVEENQNTWENLRANGDTWYAIMTKIKMPHMALLRNLRGIFSEIEDMSLCKETMDNLVNGVAHGKQFPFRYYTAKQMVESCSDVHHKAIISDGLEACMDKSCENLPKLKGKNAFLSDNSGSAWGTCTSEFGRVTIGNIDNLSAVIGAVNSDEGFVYTFGDRLIEVPINKRNGILSQAEKVNEVGQTVGGGTENGVWLFFDKAIRNKEHWDNIFIYSDMQAGHGGLYGTYEDCSKYSRQGYSIDGRYIDVAKLINTYRSTVNPKVNVYCVQTAGYDNVLVPEYGYRTNILYGWTGKELLFADAMNKFWDAKDAESEKKKAEKANK